MVSIKTCVIAGASLLTLTAAVPTSSTPRLDKRKNTNKCEAHIHSDASNSLEGVNRTHKFAIDILDASTPAKAIGYDYDWANVGTWYATNPVNEIKIKTSKGYELWIDGHIDALGFLAETEEVAKDWRNSYTLKYNGKVWNSHECENWKFKAPTSSNGQRFEFDLWCEFDC